jgi:2-desacetyl-2-hydroxyethyl bacteriochlorophyllide A dehydrogenase
MKAIQLVAHGNPGRFELRELPEPAPRSDEVVVQVQACGLNHLDLWLEQGELPMALQLPRTPGCEVAGRIVAIGPEVTAWRPGDSVVIQSNIFCARCEYCRRGQESFCLMPVMLGVQVDGGFAERVCVPQRALVRLPPALDFQGAACISLAGSTAMHMLTDRTTVNAEDWVLVIGAGSGVGSAAIQIARGLGARVIATGSTEAKRRLGQQLGAQHAIDSTAPDWPAEVRKLTAKRGVDVVVEHVGGRVLLQSLECLARGGTIVTCGATDGRDVQVNLWPFFVKQHRLVGSYSRNAADLRRTLEWAAAGQLKPALHAVFPLDRTPEAFAALRSRSVAGKIVIEPFEGDAGQD